MTPESSPSPTPAQRFMEEPALTTNARKVLEARYLKKDEAGQCTETAGALFRRVARAIAEVEAAHGADADGCEHWAHQFYDLMTSGRFMPNSPTLMNAGREMGMLSACFVLPVRDSIVDIFDSIKHTALIQKAGGGTGFAFDELRPTGDYIASSGGTTSGPISFWRAFSEATNAIQQGAFRRGANMGMMYIHHPDILKFLHAKQDLNQFTNYNISVKVTDTWMEEFRADPDSPHLVRNPRNGKAYVLPRGLDIWKYDMRHLVEVTCVAPVDPAARERYYTTPRQTGPLPAELAGQVYTKRDIWDIIVSNAWRTGEPGIVFIDRINQHNPTPQLGRIEATNPCGEQPLLPYEACNLGSLNLGAFVRQPCTPAADVDWDALRAATHLATRFLDDVIDANNYPLPEIEEVCQGNRKIGLGLMGFADALFQLGVPYNSQEGVAWGERFMRFIDDEAHAASAALAAQRGCFPNWRGSRWDAAGRPMRNAAVTTVAPTGTISILANCSGGIEPMFSLAFLRNVLRGQKEGAKPLVEVNETFRAVAAARGFLSEELLDRLAREGTLAHIPGVPPDVRRVFVCAHDIAPEWHMRMQAAFQQHCDSSISKTINFPHEASREDVEKIYHLAYELGCKGVTVYRDRCREGQPMALKNGDPPAGVAAAPSGSAAADPNAAAPPTSDAAPAGPNPAPRGSAATPRALEPQDLPEIVSGLRIRQMTPFGNMHVKITVDPRPDRELEVFAQLGKGGDVANSDLEAICRMVSLWLRAGGTLRHVIKQLEGIGSSLQIPTRSGRITSLPDGLACALKKYMKAKERFGLRALLLGDIDLAELDRPLPPHDRLADVDRAALAPAVPAAPERLSAATVAPLGPAAGRGNGGSGGGLAGRVAEAAAAPVVERTAADLARAVDSPRRSGGSRPVAMQPGGGNGNGREPRRRLHTMQDAEQGATAIAELEESWSEADEAVGVLVAAQATAVLAASATMQMSGTLGAALGLDEAGGRRIPLRHSHDAATHYILRCPQCGGVVARQEGCLKCASHCGWAAC